MLKAIMSVAVLSLLLQSVAATEPVFIAEDDWYPYTGLENGQPAGLTLEIIRAAYSKVGVKPVFKSLPYARCMLEAKTARFAGCFNTSRTNEFNAEYLFPKTPLLSSVIYIYGAVAHPEQGLTVKSLEGKTVGVANGYTFGQEFDSNKKIKRAVSSKESQAFQKLALGRVDYVVAWEGTANQILKRHPEVAKLVKPVGQLPNGVVYLSFSKAYPNVNELITQFDEGMEKLKQNGELKALEDKWYIR